MMRFCWLCLLPGICLASPWDFTAPVTVSDPALAPHYHHLDGAGRRHLAVSGNRLALVWEDDRSGDPQVYLATKDIDGGRFDNEYLLSSGEEAYEPVIVALTDNRWIAAWEQDGEIFATVIGTHGPAESVNLSNGPARQVTLAAHDEEIWAVWGRREGRDQLLEVHGLDGNTTARVSPEGASHYQGFPAAAIASDGNLVIAWEDRRAGHTRILSNVLEPGGGFTGDTQLNEHREPDATESYLTNKGTGAMRPAIAATAGVVQSVWLDKRSPGSGYAVWGTRSADGGMAFESNVRVQDTMGDAVAQWHASVIATENGFIAAWDDTRENWSDENETGDVYISWTEDDGWSDDLMVPGASGEGYQGSPVVAADSDGGIHVVWIERQTLTSPSQLRYVRGVPVE